MSTNAAASVQSAENLLFFTLMQLVVILLAARAGGAAALRVGQARVVGEIVVGLLLGPSLFGAFAPTAFEYVFHSVPSTPLTIMSQIGLILLMFQIGLDFDFSHLRERENGKAVLLVSALGLALPFVLGVLVASASHDALAPHVNALGYSLFLGTALSITAVPILGRIMMEFDLTRTSIGVITITSAACNDVIGWITLAAVTALTLSAFSLPGMQLNLGLLGLYSLCCWFVLRPLIRFLLARFRQPDAELSQAALAILLALIFLSAMATYKLGIFAIIRRLPAGGVVARRSPLRCGLESENSRFRHCVFPAYFFYLYRLTHQHWRSGQHVTLGMVPRDPFRGHAGQIWRLLHRRPLGRPSAPRVAHHRGDDEHPRPHGARRGQCGIRSRGHSAACVYHAGDHGGRKHAGYRTSAAFVVAETRTRSDTGPVMTQRSECKTDELFGSHINSLLAPIRFWDRRR